MSHIDPLKVLTGAGIALVVGATVIIIGLNTLNWALA